MTDLIRSLSPGYTPEQYMLFLLALAGLLAFICLAALLNKLSDWWQERRLERQREQLRAQNHHADLRRRHQNYLASMTEVLESLDGRKSA